MTLEDFGRKYWIVLSFQKAPRGAREVVMDGLMIAFLAAAIFALAYYGVLACRIVFQFTPTKTVKVLGGFVIYVLMVCVLIAWGQESRMWMLISLASAVVVLGLTFVLARWAKTKQWPPQTGLFN